MSKIILFDFYSRYVEACLCCLRTLFSHPDAPVEVLYSDPVIIPHLLALMPLSTSNQISVASILMNRYDTKVKFSLFFLKFPIIYFSFFDGLLCMKVHIHIMYTMISYIQPFLLRVIYKGVFRKEKLRILLVSGYTC